MKLEKEYDKYYTVFGGSYEEYKEIHLAGKVFGLIVLLALAAALLVFARG